VFDHTETIESQLTFVRELIDAIDQRLQLGRLGPERGDLAAEMSNLEALESRDHGQRGDHGAERGKRRQRSEARGLHTGLGLLGCWEQVDPNHWLGDLH
jgi:hypothetical protein